MMDDNGPRQSKRYLMTDDGRNGPRHSKRCSMQAIIRVAVIIFLRIMLNGIIKGYLKD